MLGAELTSVYVASKAQGLVRPLLIVFWLVCMFTAQPTVLRCRQAGRQPRQLHALLLNGSVWCDLQAAGYTDIFKDVSAQLRFTYHLMYDLCDTCRLLATLRCSRTCQHSCAPSPALMQSACSQTAEPVASMQDSWPLGPTTRAGG